MVPLYTLRKSKSMCSIVRRDDRSLNRVASKTLSESSFKVFIVESASDDGGKEGGVISKLERKVDRLGDLFIEHSLTLTDLSDLCSTLVIESEEKQSGCVSELLRNAIVQACEQLHDAEDSSTESEAPHNGCNSRARRLLAAIQNKNYSLDRDIRKALLDLIQSDELRTSVVCATVEGVRDLLQDTFAREMSDAYTPIIENSQRRLGRQMLRALEAAFAELEESTVTFSNSIYRTTRALRRTMERHQEALQGAGDDLPARSARLENEIQESDSEFESPIVKTTKKTPPSKKRSLTPKHKTTSLSGESRVLQEEMRRWRTQALAAALFSVLDPESPATETASTPLSPLSSTPQSSQQLSHQSSQQSSQQSLNSSQPSPQPSQPWSQPSPQPSPQPSQQLSQQSSQQSLHFSQQSTLSARETPAPEAWVSSPQPANPNMSPIDLLMKKAEINKKFSDGDINGGFEKALSAEDLWLVVCACRGAGAGRVFGPPCALQQHVLLSLTQQLATDMVHETELKCRYLEDALLSLDPTHPNTKRHLTMLITNVRANLSYFLKKYPGHVYARRIALICMAARKFII